MGLAAQLTVGGRQQFGFFDIAGVNNMPVQVLLARPHVNNLAAVINDAHRHRQAQARDALCLELKLIEQHGQRAGHETRDEQGIVAGEFNDVGHFGSSCWARIIPCLVGSAVVSLWSGGSCYTAGAMEGLRIRFSALLLLTLSLTVAAQQTRDEAAAELAEVRQRLETLQADLERDSGRRSAAERELREVERAEQQARRALAAAEVEVRTATARQASLQEEVHGQEAELERQRELLARQLRAAYISGGGERLQLLLREPAASELGRQLVYYDYLARQRSAEIAEVNDAVAVLRETQAELAQQLDTLRELKEVAAGRVTEIGARRAERAEVLARISADITTRDAEIARLNSQAEELSQLVAALTAALPELQMTSAEPFAGQADQLDWPADGPLLKTFGQPRADGSLKWQGVLVGADPGAEVRAVYHGRVVFADWLAGMGLLTIIEHGDGYMSLYGHNQDLLKPVGAYVTPGETIAHVGDSGGQASAGLYFEIRKNGEPVNPQRWMR